MTIILIRRLFTCILKWRTALFCLAIILLLLLSVVYLPLMSYRFSRRTNVKLVSVVGEKSQKFWNDFTTKFTRCQQRCEVTKDKTEADGLLFLGRDLPSINNLPSTRPKTQRWIYVSLDPPQYLFNENMKEIFLDKRWRYQFNWTATYKTTADIYVPFGYYEKLKNPRPVSQFRSSDFYSITTKSKLAYTVFNMCIKSDSAEYVLSLRSLLGLDIFGPCSQAFPYKNHKEASKYYMFYLAVEEYMCQDYITSTFWANGLNTEAVPVAYGGRSTSDYDEVAPEKAYIDGTKIGSGKDLVDYLNQVADTDGSDKYITYFHWRLQYKAYQVDQTMQLACGICKKLHDDGKEKTVDMNQVWNVNMDCNFT